MNCKFIGAQGVRLWEMPTPCFAKAFRAENCCVSWPQWGDERRPQKRALCPPHILILQPSWCQQLPFQSRSAVHIVPSSGNLRLQAWHSRAEGKPSSGSKPPFNSCLGHDSCDRPFPECCKPSLRGSKGIETGCADVSQSTKSNTRTRIKTSICV